MDKRYQIFVSSTYADLREERQKVMQALMEMDCIPAGMELFPAAADEQWEFIKRVIGDCDYYILIIGGRYGSVTAEGISYTEREYDYALDRGLKVLSFLHENPDDIAVGKSDIEPALRIKLEAFRNKASRSKLVKFWTQASDLPRLVTTSLSKTIATSPAVGWVRANGVAGGERLPDIAQLRKENADLRANVDELKGRLVPDASFLAGFYDLVEVSISWTDYCDRAKRGKVRTSWRDIFALLAPKVELELTDKAVNANAAEIFYRIGQARMFHRIERSNFDREFKMDENDLDTIRIQLSALGLIETRVASGYRYWRLSQKGQRLMIQLRTVKRS